MEPYILQHKVVSCRLILRNAAASYQGCIFYLPNSQIPFQPDLIRVDQISQQNANTLNTNHWILRSNIVNDDILFCFPGVQFNISPGTIIKPTRPITDIRMTVSYWGLTGGAAGTVPVIEQQPNTGVNAMGALTTLFVQLSFFQMVPGWDK